jgi:HTH-type transcriptional regulator, sugar sensing transcriptional regulator
MIVELLQQVGLSKYDAEAYVALLQHGPLTGYELGKRSGVPLSRSYEILERLHSKGLALVQPGDPPRYAAEDPQQFLARTRSATLATFDALAQGFAEMARPQPAAGFWVLRGRDGALAHAQGLIGKSMRSVALNIPSAERQSLEAALLEAQGRGCRVLRLSGELLASQHSALLLVVDDQVAMVGTLHPPADCQAVASSNPAFVNALRRSFAPFMLANTAPRSDVRSPAPTTQSLDWLDWEDRKQHQLLQRPPDKLA